LTNQNKCSCFPTERISEHIHSQKFEIAITHISLGLGKRKIKRYRSLCYARQLLFFEFFFFSFWAEAVALLYIFANVRALQGVSWPTMHYFIFFYSTVGRYFALAPFALRLPRRVSSTMVCYGSFSQWHRQLLHAAVRYLAASERVWKDWKKASRVVQPMGVTLVLPCHSVTQHYVEVEISF